MPDEINEPEITVADIESAPDSARPATTPEEKVQQLIADLALAASERERLRDENQKLRQEVQDVAKSVKTKQILDELIEPYARKAYQFMCWYCGAVGIIVLFYGSTDDHFYFADSVMELLVGSTAVTVIGLVGMVLTGIFVGARSK